MLARHWGVTVLVPCLWLLWACEPEEPKGRGKGRGEKTGTEVEDEPDEDDATGTGTDSGTGTGADGACVDPAKVKYNDVCVSDGKYVFLRDAYTATALAATSVPDGVETAALTLKISDLAAGDKVMLTGQLPMEHDGMVGVANASLALKIKDTGESLAAVPVGLTPGMAGKTMTAAAYDVVAAAGARTYETAVTVQGGGSRTFNLQPAGAALTALVFHETTIKDLAATGGKDGYFFVRTDRMILSTPKEEAATGSAPAAGTLPATEFLKKSVAVVEGDLVVLRGTLTAGISDANINQADPRLYTALAVGETNVSGTHQAKMHDDAKTVQIPLTGLYRATADGQVDLRLMVQFSANGTFKASLLDKRVGFEAMIFRKLSHYQTYLGSAAALAASGEVKGSTFNLKTGATSVAKEQDVATAAIDVVRNDTVGILTYGGLQTPDGIFPTRLFMTNARQYADVTSTPSVQAALWLNAEHLKDGLWTHDSFFATDDKMFAAGTNAGKVTVTLRALGLTDRSPPPDTAFDARIQWMVFRPIPQ